MRTTLPILMLHTIPPALFLGFTFSMRDEYFFAVYFLMAIVFLLASMTAGFWNARKSDLLKRRPGWALFLGIMAAWVISLCALGLLNLTPLCLGQDNGDGINGISECILYTVLAGGIYTAAMMTLVALVALVGGFMISRLDKRNRHKELT